MTYFLEEKCCLDDVVHHLISSVISSVISSHLIGLICDLICDLISSHWSHVGSLIISSQITFDSKHK